MLCKVSHILCMQWYRTVCTYTHIVQPCSWVHSLHNSKWTRVENTTSIGFQSKVRWMTTYTDWRPQFSSATHGRRWWRRTRMWSRHAHIHTHAHTHIHREREREREQEGEEGSDNWCPQCRRFKLVHTCKHSMYITASRIKCQPAYLHTYRHYTKHIEELLATIKGEVRFQWEHNIETTGA